jgi:uncharacterized membrane protein
MTAQTIIIRLALTAALATACRAGAAPVTTTSTGDDAEWRWPVAPPLRVYTFRGYWYPVLQMDRAWARLGGVDDISRWNGPQVPARFPATREDINRYHLIVAVDMDIPSWPAGALELCRDYVHQGGAMLFIGGRYAFSAGYAGSPMEEISPVTFRGVDSLMHAEEGMMLKPGPQAHEFAADALNMDEKPRAYWVHRIEPKPGALVITQADTNAILVAGNYGKGRVAVFAGTVMGDPPAGQTPFWAWRDWPELMVRTTRWLTAPAAGRSAAEARPLPADSERTLPGAAPVPAPATAKTAAKAMPAEADDLEDMLMQIEQLPSQRSAVPGMDTPLMADPESVRLQAVERHQRRLDELAETGHAGLPSSIPSLRQVIKEHRRDRGRDPHEGRGRTEADTLHDEALLAAVLCGDESSVRPLVDLLLQLDYTVVGMFGRGWGERDLKKREELHGAAQLIRAWSWQAGERLRNAPPSVLPALAARIAEETEPWIVPLAHRLFGKAFRGEPLPAAAEAALRNSTLPAINELVTE